MADHFLVADAFDVHLAVDGVAWPRYATVMMKQTPTRKEMSRARCCRDSSYDGVFWVCVCTTGVFCRPSCPAKTPQEANVTYALSVQEALLAGYRPCKRCRPLETDGRPPEWVRALLALADGYRARRLTDADLRGAGIDPARARRYFRDHLGMTFHAFHRAARLGGALGKLQRGSRLIDAGLDHGYESDSGFRSAFARQFGATPGRSGGVRPIVLRSLESPVGRLELAATERGVCLLEFGDRRSLPTEMALLKKKIGGVVPGTNEHIESMADELAQYFAGRLTHFATPLEIVGTPFQRRVWAELCRIPYSRTVSYAEVARRVGRPGAVRAVGRANGTNRIAIAIPCHRVVGADGKLCGYGGGLWRKQFLLDVESSSELLPGCQRPT